MHDGIWFAWHAARRFHDQQVNPEKYKKQEEIKKQQTAKVGWTVNKILQIHGMETNSKPISNELLQNIFGNKK